jgi:hypothetical protein
MSFVYDPINIINIILCIIIVVLGFLGYKKNRYKVPMYIAIAFGLFGLSHLATLLDLAKTLEIGLIIIRTLAYLTVIIALFKIEMRN